MAQSVCDRVLGDYCWTGALGWLGYSDGVWSPVTEATVIEVVRRDLINQLSVVPASSTGTIGRSLSRCTGPLPGSTSRNARLEGLS